jgi:hypothetical protein
VVELSD